MPHYKLTITSPSVTSPLTKYAAGKAFTVTWSYYPPASISTTVNLNCASPGAGSASSSASFTSSTNISIGSNVYGSNCTLTLIKSNSSYDLMSSVFLAITQQLSFESPIRGNSYALSARALSIKLKTPLTTIITSVSTTLQCGSNSSSAGVSTNTAGFIYTVPAGYSGLCTLTPIPTSPAQDYLTIPTTTMSIFLKYNLTYASIAPNSKAGGAFSFIMNTVPSDNVSQTVDVNLMCGGPARQSWTAVPVNQLYSTILSTNFIAETTSCTLQTSSSSASFFQSVSAAFLISTNTFVSTIPSSGAKIESGSTFNVTWSVSAGSPVGTTYTAHLDCPEFKPISASTTSLSASLSIPSTYYGSSCTVNIDAAGFTSASFPVIVTQVLSFDTPSNNGVFVLTTSSVPVKLITGGGNVYDSVSLSFQCGIGEASVSSFPVNTNSLTQTVSSSQYGSCSLTITSAANYLVVYPSASVTFTLKYTLNFTTLPAILYLGQRFAIQMSTVTAADAPPPVTLNLICPTEVISGSWSNVSINQPKTLVMGRYNSSTSCFFRVNSDSTYDLAISPNITVRKVPVTIISPISSGIFFKPNAVPLQVTTTVTPVNGTVNLQLNCTGLTVPFPVTIPINTAGSFNCPQNGYGACRLLVVDQIFGI